MDYLRSCYLTEMRLDPSSPAELRSVRWYRADPAAALYNNSTPFRSRNYANQTSDDGSLGEVFGSSKPWSNGATPSPYPPGLACGSGMQFQDGITLGGVWPVGPNGVKSCCASSVDCCSSPMPFGSNVHVDISFPAVPCLDGISIDLPWSGSGYVVNDQPCSCGPPHGPSGCRLNVLFKCNGIGDCHNTTIEVDVVSSDSVSSGLSWVASPALFCSCGPPAFFQFVLPLPVRLGPHVGQCDSAVSQGGGTVSVTGS